MKNGSLLFLILSFICFPAEAKVLRVGVALRLNDSYNMSVTSLKNGFEAAKIIFEKENPGIHIELKSYWHSRDLASVTESARKGISDKIPAMLGGEMSEESLVLGELLNDSKIVLMTPTSSNPKVTENRPFVFRGCFSDDAVAARIARYTMETLKPKSIGVIHNVSSPYSDFLSKKFVEAVNKISELEPIGSRPAILVQKVLRRTLDFSKQLDVFTANHVTHVAVFSHDLEMIPFVTQAEARNFYPTYLGSDGWGANEHIYRKFIAESRSGAHFVGIRNSYWKEDSQSPVTKKFRAIYQKQFGRAPEAWAAIAFDSAWVLFLAMSKAKNPLSGEDIRRELLKLSRVRLVTTDQFTFAHDNSPDKDLYLYRISQQGVQFEATLR